jgi:hypothetical protein
MSCEETREHLESCEECRLWVAVEARLRTQPVLDVPAGFASRVMKALPRAVPVKREIFRLAAAAALLAALVGATFAAGLDRNEAAVRARARGEEVLRSMAATLNPFKGDLPWNR